MLMLMLVLVIVIVIDRGQSGGKTFNVQRSTLNAQRPMAEGRSTRASCSCSCFVLVIVIVINRRQRTGERSTSNAQRSMAEEGRGQRAGPPDQLTTGPLDIRRQPAAEMC